MASKIFSLLSPLSRSPILDLPMVKRVVVTLEDGQYLALQTLRGLGETDSEKVKNLILIYVHQKLPKTASKEEKDPLFV